MKRHLVIIACTACAAVTAAWMTSRSGSNKKSDQVQTYPQQVRVDSDAGRAVVQSIDAKIEGRREYYRTLREQVGAMTPEQWLRGFALTERSGATVTDQELHGQPYVASFFFSRCPSICVQQNDKVKLLQTKFRDEAVRFVSITCDPEYDTPEVLREYANRIGASPDKWLFLTGDWDYLRRVSAEVFFNGLHSPRFHIEKLLLVDERGQILTDYDWHDPEEMQALERDLRTMLTSLKRVESE